MAWLLVVVLALPRVSLVVFPRISRAGTLVRVECLVARHPANRQLDFGLIDWAVSSRVLDGEVAQVIYTQVLHVPCTDQVTAFCLLTSTERTYRDLRTVQIVGCE